MKTEQIREMLDRFQKEMKANGLEFFCVAAMPGTDEGASIYDGKNIRDGAATNARTAHMKWEKARGIDSKHDWAPAFLSW